MMVTQIELQDGGRTFKVISRMLLRQVLAKYITWMTSLFLVAAVCAL